MSADSPNDKRHVLVAFMRPTPICMATCRNDLSTQKPFHAQHGTRGATP